jgi:hypothetical protein
MRRPFGGLFYRGRTAEGDAVKARPKKRRRPTKRLSPMALWRQNVLAAGIRLLEQKLDEVERMKGVTHFTINLELFGDVP